MSLTTPKVPFLNSTALSNLRFLCEYGWEENSDCPIKTFLWKNTWALSIPCSRSSFSAKRLVIEISLLSPLLKNVKSPLLNAFYGSVPLQLQRRWTNSCTSVGASSVEHFRNASPLQERFCDLIRYILSSMEETKQMSIVRFKCKCWCCPKWTPVGYTVFAMCVNWWTLKETYSFPHSSSVWITTVFNIKSDFSIMFLVTSVCSKKCMENTNKHQWQ